jgi:DNA repair protein RadC
MTQDQTIQRALKILDARMRSGPALSSPAAVRDYLRLLLHDRGHEVFVCVFLDNGTRPAQIDLVRCHV